MIIDAIKNSDATVTAKLSGTVASAATIITLACDKVVTTPYLSFMIHNYSTGMQGKGHELKAYQNFTDRELNRAFRDIYRGFLTEEEMDRVIDGLDLWINEVEVLDRWQNRIDLNNKGN
jgi:ATP-dependent protease ClpP protease subunit